MSARMSAPRARRIVAAGVIAAVLTAGSVGVAAATPLDGPDTGVGALADEGGAGGGDAPAPAAEDGSGEDVPAEDGSGEDGSAEDGSGEDGSAEDGSGGDGSAEDGSGGDGSAEDGTDEDGSDEEPPADVVVVAPTVADATVQAIAGETTAIDLDAYVTAGSGEIVGIDLEEWPGDRANADYDWDTHVLTVSPWEGGTFTAQFVAVGRTAGASGADERSSTGTLTIVVPEPVDPVVSWAQTPAASTTSTSARFTVNVDPGEFTLGYVVDLPPGAQSASPVEVQGNTFEVTGLAVGRHTVGVSVQRGAGTSWLEYTWEVVGSAPVLAADAIPAATIRAGISRGASGESVAIIQRVVGTPADGRFGAATRAAVVAFQRAHGLVADGIVGPLTWAAIVSVANGGTGIAPVTATSIPAAQIARGISRGASGPSVAIVQRIVGADADGRFGPRTQAAVRAWQKAHGLVADGIVGRLTWAAIVAR
ncbi:peptidoglycan-binding domain-containing protein [Cellulomonas fengjieae]|uniref:peptidoglycan-binding domain-containing protein n=1 Tax=Cellulomonas fengjieae TaxID=2819978 RepID=UPI001AAF8390|nr:peptidoglycan-binding protein [Cellulomonas fengjieae]MBO3100389.1 peptidoglycan-binding protein [Cellulomonas fengjieae]